MTSIVEGGPQGVPRMWNWAFTLTALGSGAAALALYLRTLAPTITWENNAYDSGELAAAVTSGGLAHPTGYPLYLLLGRLFVALPGMEPARALNLFSALSAAAAVLVCSILGGMGEPTPEGGEAGSRYEHAVPTRDGPVLGATRIDTANARPVDALAAPAATASGSAQIDRRGGPLGVPLASRGAIAVSKSRQVAHHYGSLGAHLAGVVVASATLAVAPVLWTQAVVTETRALAALLMALTLYALHGAATGRRHPAVATFALGVAVSDHQMALTLAPAVALIVGRALFARGWSALLPTMLALCCGPLLYLYLPLRAAAHPAMNWGDPSTPDRLLWVATGAQYHQYVGPGDAGVLSALGAATSAFTDQVGLSALLLALLGLLVLLFRGSWHWGAALFITTAVSIALSAFYQADAGPYYVLPALLCVAIAAGRGAQAAVAMLLAWSASCLWLLSRRVTRLLPLLVLAAGLFWPTLNQAQGSYDLVRLSSKLGPFRYGAHAIASLAPRAVIVAQGDDVTGSLWYQRYGLGRRSDVTIVNVDLLQWSWYTREVADLPWLDPRDRQALLAADRTLSGSDLATARLTVLARSVAHLRPLYFTTMQDTLSSICDDQQSNGYVLRCIAHGSR